MNKLEAEVNNVMNIFGSAMDAVAASLREYKCDGCGQTEIFTDIFPHSCTTCGGQWLVNE